MTSAPTLPAQALPTTPPRGASEAARKLASAAPADAPRRGADDNGFATALDNACARPDDSANPDANANANANANAATARAARSGEAQGDAQASGTAAPADGAATSEHGDTAQPSAVAAPLPEFVQWLPGWPPAMPAVPAATPAAAALLAAGTADGATGQRDAALAPALLVDATRTAVAATTAAPTAATTARDERQAPPAAHASAVAAEHARAQAVAALAGSAAQPAPAGRLAAASAQAGSERQPDALNAALPWLLPPGASARDVVRSDHSGALPGAPTPGHVAAALDSPGFAPALATQIKWLVRAGVQHAQLSLNPAETGPLTVQIALDGNQARIDFSADLAATRTTIEASLPTLAAALHSAGLTLAGGGVFDGQARQGTRQEPASAAAHGTHDSPTGTPAADGAAAGTGRAPRGLVDLVA